MKSDLERLLQDRALEALIVVGPDGLGTTNAPFRYFTGEAHLTGVVVKRRGHAPVLLHSDMERDAAGRTGLDLVPFSRWPLKEIYNAFGDPLSARVELYRRILADLGVSGRVAVAGVDELGGALPFWDRLRKETPGLDVVHEPEGTVLEEAFLTKDAAELALLERAAGAACAVVDELRDVIGRASVRNGALADRSGELTVGRVRGLALERLHALGLQSPEGFILSTNGDAGVPHHQGDDAHVLAEGDVVLFDFYPRGAGGYHHDITRTWSVGPARAEVRSTFEDVRSCFEHVMERVRPGASTRDLQSETCAFFEARGHATIRQDPTATSGYVHSLGHGIGLDVHERPHFPTFRSGPDTRLEPGMAITIEPGLYYPERGLGVRIEDTVVVTETGARRLSTSPTDLEITLRGARPARARA